MSIDSAIDVGVDLSVNSRSIRSSPTARVGDPQGVHTLDAAAATLD